MSDTLFADVSSYQVPVDDTYPYQFVSFRSNDGTYRDGNFAANLAWAKGAADSGRITGFLVYLVWEPNWQDTVATFKAMVGAPHPLMAVMIDVESWSGKISGDQSAGINAAREQIISWLGGNRARVIGYANSGDFADLWPNRGDARVVLANYSANPDFPGKIAHQFSSTFDVPPFGPCDINSADGYSPDQFAAALGLTTAAAAAPLTGDVMSFSVRLVIDGAGNSLPVPEGWIVTPGAGARHADPVVWGVTSRGLLHLGDVNRNQLDALHNFYFTAPAAFDVQALDAALSAALDGKTGLTSADVESAVAKVVGGASIHVGP